MTEGLFHYLLLSKPFCAIIYLYIFLTEVIPMGKLSHLQPERVFYYFEEICGIPHGSGDTARISDYCVAFACLKTR